MADHGHFYWNELLTPDVEAAKAFYAKTAGWTFDAMDMGDQGTYWVCMDGDKATGGIFPASGPELEGLPPHWMGYVAVDDIDDTVEKAKASGGTVLKPVFEVPDVGRIAMIQDPTGAVLGWITPAQKD